MKAKLSRHAFLRFWDLHAWAGVLSGLVLYVMFLTGAITLFREPLELWEEPLARARTVEPLDAVVERVRQANPDLPGQYRIFLPDEEHGPFRLGHSSPEGTWQEWWIDPATGTLTAERERLSEFLYHLHYLWHDAIGTWLYYLGGFLAVALLLAVVSGLLIHLKDVVRQFYQFRPHKRRRVLWSDMHKVLGVFGLPFQVVYAYTGAFIVLAPFVLPLFIDPVFGGDAERGYEVVYGAPRARIPAPGPEGPGLATEALIARARAEVPALEPASVVYRHPGHQHGLVEVRGRVGPEPLSFASVRLRESDGTVVALDVPDSHGGNQGATGVLQRWVYGLHFAYFGGWILRALFFVLALATCATILTGNWIWLARRDPHQRRAGNRLLARLTTGVGGGTLVAIAALFVASRVLPLELPGRGQVEELVFIAPLAASIAWALASRAPQELWWRLTGLAGLGLALTPLLAARTSAAGLFGGGPRLGEVLAVDAALLAVGLGLVALATGLRRHLRPDQETTATGGPR